VNATLVLPPVAAGKSAPRAGRLCLGSGPKAGQMDGLWLLRRQKGAPGSAGGELMGAVVNSDPDLWGAADGGATPT